MPNGKRGEGWIDGISGIDLERFIATLPRCASCGVRVPRPTSTGQCIYCMHRSASIIADGAVQAAIPETAADEVTAEGEIPSEPGPPAP